MAEERRSENTISALPGARIIDAVCPRQSEGSSLSGEPADTAPIWRRGRSETVGRSAEYLKPPFAAVDGKRGFWEFYCHIPRLILCWLSRVLYFLYPDIFPEWGRTKFTGFCPNAGQTGKGENNG